jgi:hypothetical protein
MAEYSDCWTASSPMAFGSGTKCLGESGDGQDAGHSAFAGLLLGATGGFATAVTLRRAQAIYGDAAGPLLGLAPMRGIHVLELTPGPSLIRP